MARTRPKPENPARAKRWRGGAEKIRRRRKSVKSRAKSGRRRKRVVSGDVPRRRIQTMNQRILS